MFKTIKLTGVVDVIINQINLLEEKLTCEDEHFKERIFHWAIYVPLVSCLFGDNGATRQASRQAEEVRNNKNVV